jgi:hypothetical protein
VKAKGDYILYIQYSSIANSGVGVYTDSSKPFQAILLILTVINVEYIGPSLIKSEAIDITRLV